MATRNETLDLALPAEIMELGEVLSAKGSFRRPSTRQVGAQQPTPEQATVFLDALLDKIRKHAVARQLLGLRRTTERDAERIRLKVVAILAWQNLRLSEDHADIGEIAAAVADPKIPPSQALLQARHVIGAMVAEDTLIGSSDGDGPIRKARLPGRTLGWLSGGKASLGFLTVARLAGMLLPKGFENDDTPPAAPTIPSVKELRTKIGENVIGLDEQVTSLSSLLVMHLARSKMLRDGKDPKTGNISVVLAGGSGCGKTWLMDVAAKKSGCPFASMSATAMTSEAYLGGKLDDLFKALVVKAKCDMQAARFGIAFADEWDKKAFRQGRDVTTLSIQQEVLVPMQGAEFLITGKKAMERPIIFNSNGTFFAFAGAFTGLSEMVRKKATKSCIGFSDGANTKRQQYVLDAIREYGFIREWVNRLTAVMFLPDPSLASLSMAAGRGVLDTFNLLVGELGIVLFPHPNAIPRMAEYALESKTFYRGLKSIWWSIAEMVVGSGSKGLQVITSADVDAAISRVMSGSVGLPEGLAGTATATVTHEEDHSDEGLGTRSAGG